MYYLNKKTGNKGFMAIKIDLAKAYDKVEWNVLQVIMINLGFERKFIDLILECNSSVHSSVLLDRTLFGFF